MIDELGFDEFGRPCKDLYFIDLAFRVAKRSIDNSTKVGCVVVDEEGGVLTTGYNGPPMGSIDSNIPSERPEKYFYYEHAERNCMYHAARNGIRLKNSTFYITSLPCMDCLRGIIQVGARRIVYGPLQSKLTNDDQYLKRYHILMAGQPLRLECFRYLEGLKKMNSEIVELLKGRDIINFEIVPL